MVDDDNQLVIYIEIIKLCEMDVRRGLFCFITLLTKNTRRKFKLRSYDRNDRRLPFGFIVIAVISSLIYYYIYSIQINRTVWFLMSFVYLTLGFSHICCPFLPYHEHFDTHYPSGINLRPFIEEKIRNNVEVPLSVLNPNKQQYIFKPPKCKFENDQLLNIVILVKSAVGNWQTRNTVRNGWKKNINPNIKVVFLLGHREEYRYRIENEALKFDDIVQQDFYDTYLNNTLKTIMSYDWVTTECADAEFILFIDDDFWLDVDNFVSFLKNLSIRVTKELYMGELIGCSHPEREDTKWSISMEDYPFDLYPPYLAGGAYIVTSYVAKLFSLSFPYVKPVGIDDAYLGFVAKKLGIKVQNSYSFHISGPFLNTKIVKHLNSGGQPPITGKEPLITPDKPECFV